MAIGTSVVGTVRASLQEASWDLSGHINRLSDVGSVITSGIDPQPGGRKYQSWVVWDGG